MRRRKPAEAAEEEAGIDHKDRLEHKGDAHWTENLFMGAFSHWSPILFGVFTAFWSPIFIEVDEGLIASCQSFMSHAVTQSLMGTSLAMSMALGDTGGNLMKTVAKQSNVEFRHYQWQKDL